MRSDFDLGLLFQNGMHLSQTTFLKAHMKRFWIMASLKKILSVGTFRGVLN